MNTGETTVLVVEPDLDTQRVYRQRLIHDPDIKLIGICSSIASATALLAQTNCDILFTELNLPDEDGLDFIRRASEDLAVQNIVAVTSKNSAADIAAAVENGAVGYITKQDSDLHDVGNYIRILRAHGSPISPTAARFLVDALCRKPTVKPVVSVAASRPAVANPLSPRETEVLNLLARGMSFAEISSVLNISCHTVTAHIKKIYRKLQVHSRGKRFTKPPSLEFFRPCKTKAEGSHLRLFLSAGFLFLQNPVAAFAAVLFQQTDVGHAHSAVYSFKHVVDSQKADLDSR